MKKNQIISMVCGGVLIFSLGFGSAYTIQENKKQEVMNVAREQLNALNMKYVGYMKSQLVRVVGENKDWTGDVGDQFFELNDGSFYIVNTIKGEYIFQPVDLGDWDVKVDNMEQLENIVATYISMKNTGKY